MSEEQKYNIMIEPFSTFAPLIAAQLVNAFYSSLLLKKLSGVEITDDEKNASREAALSQWARFLEILQSPKKSPSEKRQYSPEEPQDQ